MAKLKLMSLWERYKEIEEGIQSTKADNPYSYKLVQLEQKREALYNEIKQVAGRKLQRFKRRLNKLRGDQDRKKQGNTV